MVSTSHSINSINKPNPNRLSSLDAFRGLCIGVMIFVNYGGAVIFYQQFILFLLLLQVVAIGSLTTPLGTDSHLLTSSSRGSSSSWVLLCPSLSEWVKWEQWNVIFVITDLHQALEKKNTPKREVLIKVIRRSAILFAVLILFASATSLALSFSFSLTIDLVGSVHQQRRLSANVQSLRRSSAIRRHLLGELSHHYVHPQAFRLRSRTREGRSHNDTPSYIISLWTSSFDLIGVIDQRWRFQTKEYSSSPSSSFIASYRWPLLCFYQSPNTGRRISFLIRSK